MMKKLFNFSEEKNLNEILFDGRNKDYGAYVLRNEENYQTTKALFSGVLLFLGVMGAYYFVTQTKGKVEVRKKQRVVVLTPIDEGQKKTEKISAAKVKPQSSSKAVVKTERYVELTPTHNPAKESLVPSKKVIDEAAIGTESKDGKKAETSYVPAHNTGSAGVGVDDGKKEVPTEEIIKNKDPYTVVDVEASFHGGMEAFRAKVSENFDASSMSGDEGLVNATVSFVVETDGTISNIKAKGSNADFNAEAERTIKKIKGKWQPAKVDGQWVRSYFKIPITMRFE